LNYPSLARSLCTPVTVPQSDGNFTTLNFYGRFVLASEGPADAISTFGQPAAPRTYLERCGSRLDEQISNGAVANTDAVVRVASNRELAGMFFPSLRRFVIRLPPGLATPPGASAQSFPLGLDAISSRTLYASRYVDGISRIWIAPAPTAPPR
jgi:hypothetical protein